MIIPLGFGHGTIGWNALKKTKEQLQKEVAAMDAFHEKDTNLCAYNQFAYQVHRAILLAVIKHKV